MGRKNSFDGDSSVEKKIFIIGRKNISLLRNFPNTRVIVLERCTQKLLGERSN